jgi:hypothetical protein
MEIDRFNKGINTLLKVLSGYHINEPDFMRVKNLLQKSIQIDPTIALRECGPYLLKYKDMITARDMQYFLNKNDWADDVGDHEDTESNLMIIEKIKNIWPKFKEAEKDFIYNVVNSLLSDYSSYLLNKINQDCKK